MKKNYNRFDKNIAILGAGAFGREVLCHIKDCQSTSKVSNHINYIFLDDSKNDTKIMDCKVHSTKDFDFKDYNVIISVGNSILRSNVVKKLPSSTTYCTFIHPSVILSDNNIYIGDGSIISPGSILTTNIEVGKHCHLNLHVTIGHDTKIGDCFSAAPGVNISGNCNIGNNVYIGTGASIKQGVSIASNTTIGMGAVVVKDILKEGTYIGNPAKRLERIK